MRARKSAGQNCIVLKDSGRYRPDAFSFYKLCKAVPDLIELFMQGARDIVIATFESEPAFAEQAIPFHHSDHFIQAYSGLVAGKEKAASAALC